MYLYAVSTNYWYKILLLSRNEVFEHILQWCSTQLLVVNHKTGGTLLQVVKNGVFIESRSHSSPWNWKPTSLLRIRQNKNTAMLCTGSDDLQGPAPLPPQSLSYLRIFQTNCFSTVSFLVLPWYLFNWITARWTRQGCRGESRYNKLEVYWTPPRACTNTDCYLEIE